MRYVCILVTGLCAAGCASRETPPPAPSATSANVEQATDTPNTGPDFTPASSDGTFTPREAGATAAEANPSKPSGPETPNTAAPQSPASGGAATPAPGSGATTTR